MKFIKKELDQIIVSLSEKELIILKNTIVVSCFIARVHALELHIGYDKESVLLLLEKIESIIKEQGVEE